VSVLVYATGRALAETDRRGVRQLEMCVENAISAGRLRGETLGGVTLGRREKHVILDARTGAIVAKVRRTPGGRWVYRVLRLVSLRPLPPTADR